MGSEGPVLVHCHHGADRTGCIVAVYRMIVNDWTREAAIEEFRNGGYGYHDKMFPNLLELLETIDLTNLSGILAMP
jgi:protein tyrosine/serine phosphatase